MNDRSNHIQLLRESLNISRDELGERMLVNRQTVSQWESGQTLPSSDDLVKLSEIFGVSVDEILGISDGEEHMESSEDDGIRESYSFRYDSKEVEGVSKCVMKPLRRSFVLCSVFSAICFIIIATSENVFRSTVFGVLFGMLIGYAALNAKSLSAAKKEWEKAVKKIPSRTYSYTVSSGMLIIKIFKDGSLICEEHNSLENISNIVDCDGYSLLVIAGRSYIVRRSDLKCDSELLLRMRSKKGIKEIPTQKTKRLNGISSIAVLASVFSVFGGFGLSSFIAELNGCADNFPMYLWTMFIFVPIPVFSVAFGLALKRKGYDYKGNIIIGIIIFCVLCLYGSLSFVFSGIG